MDISGSLRMKIRDRRTKIQLSLESYTLILTKFPSLSGPQLVHLYQEDTEAPRVLCYSKVNSKSNNKKEREKEIQEYTSCRSSKTTKDDWKKGFGGEKGGSENLSSGRFWKVIHGLGGAPSGLDQKQNSFAISCLCTDAGLQIPTWEHLLGTTTWQISRQLGSRPICAKNMGPPAVGGCSRKRGPGWERCSYVPTRDYWRQKKKDRIRIRIQQRSFTYFILHHGFMFLCPGSTL